MAVAADPSTTFQGFRPEAIQFLVDLAENNSRDWFQPRKADYERLLKEPMEQLCVALEEQFRGRATSRSTPTRAKSPFRIYRDMRFSKDKSPYKTARRGELRLGRRRRRGRGRPIAHRERPRERRLLPPPAGRDLRRRRRLASRAVVARRLPAADRRPTTTASGRSSRRRRSRTRSARSATTASR